MGTRSQLAVRTIGRLDLDHGAFETMLVDGAMVGIQSPKIIALVRGQSREGKVNEACSATVNFPLVT